jgi:hypothetical protein
MDYRPLVFYHRDCQDGFMAGYLIWKMFGNNADYVKIQYGYKSNELPEYKDRDVYLVDFSLREEDTRKLLRDVRSLFLITMIH